MRIIALAALGAVLSLAACSKPQEAADASGASAGPADYTQDINWLCRPGRRDSCDADMSATVIAPDGGFTKAAFSRNASAPVDCFYVYPTASGDDGVNSDLTPGDPGEISTVQRQAALLGAECRVFAPMYRSITLKALRGGQSTDAAREIAYQDVKAAWLDYLARDNSGRGVVLYGHSQGAGVLKRLIAEEVDGKPIQSQIVLAMLIGAPQPILVPTGADVGGDYKAMPICRKDGQTGCLIAYSTFREGSPPPLPTGDAPGASFGVSKTEGMEAACANPAKLEGGKAVMRPHVNATAVHPAALPPKPWVTPAKTIETTYVQVPGLVSGECVKDGQRSYLEISVNADPADPRTDEVVGDHYRDGKLLPEMGLHSLDVPVALGDLAARVRSASAAWLAANKD